MTNVKVLSESKKIFTLCWVTLRAVVFIPPDYELLLENRRSINFARRNAAHKLLLEHHLEKLDYQILIECLESNNPEMRAIAWIQLETLSADAFDIEILNSYQNHKNSTVSNTALYLIKRIEKENSAST